MTKSIEQQLAEFPFEKLLRSPEQCLGTEPFGFLPKDMLNSTCFQAISFNALKVLLAIMRKHLNTGETQNGRLSVTYAELEREGCSRNLIRQSIAELEHYGFIRRVGIVSGGNGTPSRNLFRLTWIGDWRGNRPTDEWRGVNDHKVHQWRERIKMLRANSTRKRASAPGRSSANIIQITQSIQRIESETPKDVFQSQICERDVVQGFQALALDGSAK